jgi:hypothetical protein
MNVPRIGKRPHIPQKPTLSQRINRTFTLAVILSAIPLGYFFLRASVLSIEKLRSSPQDQAFIDSTMGNWFSTTLGLAAGVPIGLWINRLQQDEQDKMQREIQENISRNNKRKILLLIRGELEDNKIILENLISKQSTNPWDRNILGMKDVLWNTFSNGGEIKWLDDPYILDDISGAYYFIKGLIALESNYFDLNFFSGVSFQGENGLVTTYAGERIVEKVLTTRPEALEKVKCTIKKISKYLEEI